VPIAVTACDANVSVTAASPEPVPATQTREVVLGVLPAASCVNVTGAGFSQQVPVTVLPTSFGGTPSTTALQIGQVLTLPATPTLRFDSTNADIDFGGGIRGIISNRTGASLSVVVPATTFATPTALTVLGVNVTYVTGLRANLPTQSLFTISNPFDPNNAPFPAATVTVPDTIFDGFQANEADNFYKFTLAGTTTFTVTMDWPGAADLDILFCVGGCSAGGDFVGNFDGATGSKPEISTVTLPAGTYNLYINNFTPGTRAPIYQVRITQ
jgi:hypothetical protein